jgi:hypothetical protein
MTGARVGRLLKQILRPLLPHSLYDVRDLVSPVNVRHEPSVGLTTIE